MKISVIKKELKTKDNKTFDCYNVTMSDTIDINVPICNMVDVVDYIDSVIDEPYDVIHSKFKKLNGKYEIYLGKSDISKFGLAIYKFKKEHNIDDEITLGYGKFKDVCNNDLFKVKISFNFFTKYIVNKLDNRKSVKLGIKRFSIYNINGKYYITLTVASLFYIVDNLDHKAVNINPETDHYRAPICELKKIKQGYRPYITDIKNKIKNRNVSLDI